MKGWAFCSVGWPAHERPYARSPYCKTKNQPTKSKEKQKIRLRYLRNYRGHLCELGLLGNFRSLRHCDNPCPKYKLYRRQNNSDFIKLTLCLRNNKQQQQKTQQRETHAKCTYRAQHHYSLKKRNNPKTASQSGNNAIAVTKMTA